MSMVTLTRSVTAVPRSPFPALRRCFDRRLPQRLEVERVRVSSQGMIVLANTIPVVRAASITKKVLTQELISPFALELDLLLDYLLSSFL